MDAKAKIREAQSKLIDHLSRYELAIASLYEVCSHAFPAHAAFWQTLVREERGHAGFLQSMYAILEKGNLFYDLGRFDVPAIEKHITEIQKESEAIDKNETDLVHALQAAVIIENSLLDGHFYEVVTSDAPEFALIAEHLAKDTRRHVAMIQDLYQKEMVIRSASTAASAADSALL